MKGEPSENATVPEESWSQLLVAKLNCRLQPVHRAVYFEDPLDEKLRAEGLGVVSGGGTRLSGNGEIEYCEVEIRIIAQDSTAPSQVIKMLEDLGAPKGSSLYIERDSRKMQFGSREGLAIYINGIDLSDEVYNSCSASHVYDEIDRLIAPSGRILSYWVSPKGFALYLYGESFSLMRNSIEKFVATYPLCRLAKVEQTA